MQEIQDKSQVFQTEIAVTDPNAQNIQNVFIQNNYYKNVEGQGQD